MRLSFGWQNERGGKRSDLLAKNSHNSEPGPDMREIIREDAPLFLYSHKSCMTIVGWNWKK